MRLSAPPSFQNLRSLNHGQADSPNLAQPAAFKAPSVEKLANDVRKIVSPDLTSCHAAFLFGALTAARRSEFALARWEEIDFDRAIWSIPAERRKDKMNCPHRVPLSKQALVLLNIIGAGTGPIFTNAKGRPLHVNSILVALRRLSSADYCLQGIRSTFRDWAEETQMDYLTTEKCLMHCCRQESETAYLVTDMLEERRAVMQAWADAILPQEELCQFGKRFNQNEGTVV